MCIIEQSEGWGPEPERHVEKRRVCTHRESAGASVTGSQSRSSIAFLGIRRVHPEPTGCTAKLPKSGNLTPGNIEARFRRQNLHDRGRLYHRSSLGAT